VSALSNKEFEIIEGVFHDGLGTYAELTLANELILLANLPSLEVDNADQRLEWGDESVCDNVRRASPDGRARRKFIYTIHLTPSYMNG
jgi:hypothetical protein